MSEKRQDAAAQQKDSRAGDMAIGEFGGAPAATVAAGPMYAAPAYWLYELSHAALNPARAFADAGRLFFKNPANLWSHTELGKSVAAACELFERSTRRYAKPEWGITSTLIVAPMSGHYPTLLRGTVEGFLSNHDVYLTEWVDARMVPLAAGRFDLDDYIDYLVSMLHALQGDIHVIAVCQPSVPVMAAVARMEADDDPCVPHSMVLMGGPIDTRVNPTAVNLLAEKR